MKMANIILYDGHCNFCNHSVQFIIRRDPKGYFSFASLQGKIGKSYLERLSKTEDLNSFILIEDNCIYTKSTAALKVCSKLKGGWKLFSILRVVPKPLRDIFYDIIAKNRYKWFGHSESCMIPTPEIKKRFLD